ncbi:carboxyl-terminal-processing peptidase 1, chloroplastic [Dorcoceras hygrometricum]|uniref:Carboxyl-terminal-processing peptidase 1, chloroplastic n=1 Tax=Dorcoceras hygrometricum TaxID=472368 RepID=A0A2Z7BVC6_9LAMI|nr:carboxyl-terminal-processing peptidase 1, chloroplastic [Dorcoceras hygrometricum]
MGIDQLAFQSVQLGYLKILQMGNADPNNTKAGKEYENIGHQGLSISWQKSQSSLYTRTVYQPGKSSVRDLLARMTHLSADHNVALSQVLNRSKAQYVCMNAMKFKSRTYQFNQAVHFNLNRSHHGTATSACSNVLPRLSRLLAQRRIQIPLPRRSGRIQNLHRERSIHKIKCRKTYLGCFSCGTLLASRRLAPTSFTGKLALQWLAVEFSESGPRLETRLLRQSALEDVTNLSWMESPRRGGRNKSNHVRRRRAARRRRRKGGGREGGGIQLAVGPQQLRLRNHNFGLDHRIMVKRLATSPHDPLGITDSGCKNYSVVVSVQYGPFNTYIPIRSMTIGKSRVARDPITLHTSRRSNSDIACVTSIGYPRTKASGEPSTTKHRLLHASGPHPIPPPNDPNIVGKRVKVRHLSCRVSMMFRVVRTNQYNQDLRLIHSTNGNHLESPNEGSSIDHQVTIHLHAQNITMFPTNETWYFASHTLVSSSGGLILIYK